MLPSYFDYIFVLLKQKVRLRPEFGPKFLSSLGPNPARTRTESRKPGPTNNSALCAEILASAHFFWEFTQIFVSKIQRGFCV